MNTDLPVIAGTISTTIFAFATLPMLVKAARTKDLSSYSIGNIGLANAGNVIHSVYVFSLPMGPIWLLHAFYLVSTALMLAWWIRYSRPSLRRAPVLARPPASIEWELEELSFPATAVDRRVLVSSGT